MLCTSVAMSAISSSQSVANVHSNGIIIADDLRVSRGRGRSNPRSGKGGLVGFENEPIRFGGGRDGGRRGGGGSRGRGRGGGRSSGGGSQGRGRGRGRGR